MTTSVQDTISGWFAGRLPDGWFTKGEGPPFEGPPFEGPPFEGPPFEVKVDNEEILVVGTLAPPELADDAGEDAREAAEAARIKRFREETREQRISVAVEAEHRFGRKVSWGASCGQSTELFTVAGVPVMTRLRMPERGVLDTLIAAGVARSRSEALAWCVRLVGRNEGEWITELREAFANVEKVRAKGPSSGR